MRLRLKPGNTIIRVSKKGVQVTFNGPVYRHLYRISFNHWRARRKQNQ